jgi:23S rRNA pseudoU1915 N3-methylase RlmH
MDAVLILAMKPQKNRSKTKFIKFMQQYFRKKKILYLHESTQHTHEIQKNSSKIKWRSFNGRLTIRNRSKRLAEYADEIKQIHDKGVEIAIVIGGGNILEELELVQEWIACKAI